jgi:hypothetical protein
MDPKDLDYQKLAMAMLEQAGTRYKGVSSTPSASYGHGPAGLFSSPGLSKPLFSAMVLPTMGLQGILEVRPTNETNPLFGIITGVTASAGSEATGVCDDPPTAGTMKLCTHQFVLGRFSRMSRVYDIDRAGKTVNRGEFLDFNVYGNALNGSAPNPNVPNMPGFNANAIAQNEVSKALYEMGVSWSRDFAKKLYTGATSNNTAQGGYKEFYGLETLVNTGYRDAETGTACPASDSYITSFGNALLSTNAAGFIRNVTYMFRNLRYIAQKSGLAPVTWVITMPYGMFYEITEVWPIAYMTYRAQGLVPTGSTNYVTASDMEAMREAMRGDLEKYEGQYLLIDGMKVPVKIDDGIPETENQDGTFTADLYFIPMTVLGGQVVTFMEYFNYDVPGGPVDMAKVFAPNDSFYTTDNGRFLWHKKPPTNFCVQLLAKTEPRLILLTPYLAGRLSSIRYSPLMHQRSPFSSSSYYVNGGKTQGDTTSPSYYSPTA